MTDPAHLLVPAPLARPTCGHCGRSIAGPVGIRRVLRGHGADREFRTVRYCVDPAAADDCYRRAERAGKAAKRAERCRGKQWRRRRRRVLERDGFACVACGATEDLTVDHRIPRCRGGSDDPENLQTMCSPCNQRKGAELPPLALAA